MSFCAKLAFKYVTDEWFLFFMNSSNVWLSYFFQKTKLNMFHIFMSNLRVFIQYESFQELLVSSGLWNKNFFPQYLHKYCQLLHSKDLYKFFKYFSNFSKKNLRFSRKYFMNIKKFKCSNCGCNF